MSTSIIFKQFRRNGESIEGILLKIIKEICASEFSVL